MYATSRTSAVPQVMLRRSRLGPDKFSADEEDLRIPRGRIPMRGCRGIDRRTARKIAEDRVLTSLPNLQRAQRNRTSRGDTTGADGLSNEMPMMQAAATADSAVQKQYERSSDQSTKQHQGHCLGKIDFGKASPKSTRTMSLSFRDVVPRLRERFFTSEDHRSSSMPGRSKPTKRSCHLRRRAESFEMTTPSRSKLTERAPARR
mmetsp:Transcript_23742/g.66026  ORF Transcript_23742/g.66026 Transcript_23742/m.66026 type:complete len:204 (-) Transcript_23742:154-765(-)